MAKKTLIEKAAEKVGYGLAMAEDLAGTVQSAVGSVAQALKKSPPAKAAKKVVKKAAGTKPRKKSAKKASARGTAKKAAKRPKKSAKKATRSRR